MSDIDLTISENGEVFILFDSKETRKLIETLKKQGLKFKTKLIFCG